MHVDNPDALKIWLTQILEPLCDADPSALARYVLALLKKDKAIKELTKCMSEQLDVFLGQETTQFLSRLFEVIESQEYLKLSPDDSNSAAAGIAAATPAVPIGLQSSPFTDNNNFTQQQQSVQKQHHHQHPQLLATTVIKSERECTPPLVIETSTSKLSKDNNSMVLIEHASPIVSPVVSPIRKSDDLSPGKPVNEMYDRDGRRRQSVRSRTRSRSRSYEKQVRSRSRDRKNAEREKSSRLYRNKSPMISGDRRRYDRRGGANHSPKPFIRALAHSLSKSRSRSPDRRKVSRSISPMDIMVSKVKRQRCRDFDEKGYCMRGETCPWDHGIDPVVLEDINNPALISIQGAPHVRGGEYSPDAPELWNRGGTFSGTRSTAANGNSTTGGQTHRGGPAGTYPRAPSTGFRGGAPFPFPLNPLATTPLQRELISVPVVDGNSGGDVSAQNKRRYEPEDTVAIAEGPAKRKLPINSRLGPRVGMQQNCSLELRKVPRGLNSIAHLNNHFSKFGKIVNIQISYDGDPEAAIVTFSTHAEANVAYRSTEAVLNNRFIKVFWHTPGMNNDVATNHQLNTKEDTTTPHIRKANQYSLNNTIPAVPTAAATDVPKAAANLQLTAVSSTANLTTTGTSSIVTTATAAAASTSISTATAAATTNTGQTAASIRARNNRVNRAATEIIRKKQEDQVKAAIQLAHGLHTRKHELLQGYIKQMRSVVELVERVDQSDSQRAKLLSTVKELQSSIDKLNKEIAAEQAKMSAQMQPQPTARKSKEQQKKELLDIELELIAQQQEGNDTTAIQKRIEELQKSLGQTPAKPHFATRNARVRPPPHGSTSVDRRPTTLHITGFAAEDSDALLGHFKHFGEITKNQLDKSVPLLVIAFTTRINAEQAILRGRTFKDKSLQISWATPNTVPPKKNDETISENVENITPEEAPEIRHEDEEDEEETESENRSWRHR